jgi:hypothetical protein
MNVRPHPSNDDATDSPAGPAAFLDFPLAAEGLARRARFE